MPLDKSKVEKILVYSLTNIGDVVLSFPVIDVLKKDFPQAKIFLIVGPKAYALVKDNPLFEKVFVYDKHKKGLKMMAWIMELRSQRLDLLVDLKNSWMPVLTAARNHTSVVDRKKQNIHMTVKHLNRLRTVYQFDELSHDKFSLYFSDKDKDKVNGILERSNLKGKEFIIISPGSAFQGKRWSTTEYARLSDKIIKTYHLPVVFIGDASVDDQIAQEIVSKMAEKDGHNLCGQTSLTQSAYLIDQSKMVIANDSAPMHMASYLDKPVLAIFINSDPIKYGPWGKTHHYLKKNVSGQGHENGNEVSALTCDDVFSCFTIKEDGIIFHD